MLCTLRCGSLHMWIIVERLVQGQAVVPSAQSQVIYSTVPLWSALLAFKFMPEETMGAVGYAGGAVVILAGVLATR